MPPDSLRQPRWRVVLLNIHRREIESLRNDQGPQYLSFTGQDCNFSLEYSVLHPADRSLLHGLMPANFSFVELATGHCASSLLGTTWR